MTPAARLAALQGRWIVRRRVRHADGSRARFHGDAVWTGGRCTERGTMRVDGQALRAERVTLWAVEGRVLAVRFADGRPFHEVGPEAGHDCPPDRYRLSYDFGSWPVWRCRWRVLGPAKDYVASTLHWPADAQVARVR